MTNTLPGEWTQLVRRLPTTRTNIEDRVRDFEKLGWSENGNRRPWRDSEQQDVLRGLLVLVEALAKGQGVDPDVELTAAMVTGYKPWRQDGVTFSDLRSVMQAL